MAALCPNICPGISYGLSQSNITDNKEVIFVKLTDSAYRAIEEYQKNQVRILTFFVLLDSSFRFFLSFFSETLSFV